MRNLYLWQYHFDDMPKKVLTNSIVLGAVAVLTLGGCNFTTSEPSFEKSTLNKFKTQNLSTSKVTVEKLDTFTYALTINLKNGAKLKPYVKSLDGSGDQGCYGWSNKFKTGNVKAFISDNPNASLIISGSFSNNGGKPAFPQKISGWTNTFGYECGNDLKMLMIRNNDGRAFIENYNESKFKSSAIAPDVIVGIDANTQKGKITDGRNFVGLKNPYNGGYGTVVFIVSKALTKEKAKKYLTNKGCTEDQIMQLDGSTVAQFSQKENGVWDNTMSESRLMPQVFNVFE